jgi:hypothetical protein
MKQRLKGQTKTQRQGASRYLYCEKSTENFEIIHTRCLNIHSTQPTWILSVYVMYKTCFLWEPSILHPHGSFMNNLQNSLGQDSKRRERAPLLITSRKENKGSMSNTQTGAHYLEETVEPTQRALTLHLLHTWRQNTHKLYSTQSKCPLNGQLPSTV